MLNPTKLTEITEKNGFAQLTDKNWGETIPDDGYRDNDTYIGPHGMTRWVVLNFVYLWFSAFIATWRAEMFLLEKGW